MRQPFEVGGHYRNRKGEYEVLTIDGDRMAIRWLDGGTWEGPVAVQARIWERLCTDAAVEDEAGRSRPRKPRGTVRGQKQYSKAWHTDLPQMLARSYEDRQVKQWLALYRSTHARLKHRSAADLSSDDLALLWQQQTNNGIASVGQAPPLNPGLEHLRRATAIVLDPGRTIGQCIVGSLTYFRAIPTRYTPWCRTLRAVAAFRPVSVIANTVWLHELFAALAYEVPFDLKRFVDRDQAWAIDTAYSFLSDQVARHAPTDDVLLRAMTPWLMREILVRGRSFSGHPDPEPSPTIL